MSLPAHGQYPQRSRNRLAMRLLQTVNALGSARLTIDELAEREQVSTRTVRRDLEALEAACLPLVHEGDYYRLERR